MRNVVLQILFCFLSGQILGQLDTIYLNNPSFEDSPRRGTIEWGYYSAPPEGWYDCGRVEFPNETPPDIHPVDFWEVHRPALEGHTYLGMVVRDVDTWESVSQRLSSPLHAGNCYLFTISLSRSNKYISLSQELQREDNYTIPAVLRIWGGDGHCGRKELLGESEPIDDYNWNEYEFFIQPKRSHRYFILEAFYKTPTLFAYNGHILLDKGSHIIQTYCPGEEVLVEVKPEPQVFERPRVPAPPVVNEEFSDSDDEAEEIVQAEDEELKNGDEVVKSNLSAQLNDKKLRTGQTIRIENLFFEADSAIITKDSYPVLDEIFSFLRRNKNVVIEIGGHTNGNFGITHEYCDELSNERAKTVAEYIMGKGISPRRLHFKGYGKRQPIASNRTIEGRQKNQRVEIKILSLDG